MKAPTQNDPQTRRPAAFTLETEETARPSATQKRAPRSFDAETATRINREVVAAGVAAGRSRGVRVAFVSRSDWP